MLTEEKMQEINKIANLDFSVLPSPNSSFSKPPASAVQQELIEAALSTFGYPPAVIAQVDFFRKPENLETLQRFAIDKTTITQNADAMKKLYTDIKDNVSSTPEEKEAATKAINNIDNMARIVQHAEQYVARMHQTFRQETYSEFDERLSTLQQKIGQLQSKDVGQLKELMERYGRLKSQFYDQSPVKVTEDKNKNELVVHAPPGVDSYNFMMHLQAQAFLEDLKAHRAELKAAQSTVGVEISRVETPAPKVTIAVSEAPKVTLSTDAVSSKKESSVSVGIHTTDDKDPTVEIAGGDPKVVANDRIANYIDPTGPKSQDPIVAAMQYLVDMLLIIYLNHMNEAQKAATHKSVDNCRTEFQQFAKENPEAAAAFLAQYKDTQIHRLLSHDGLGVNQARDEYYDSRTKDSPRTEIIVPRSLEGRPAGEVISKLKEMTRIDNASIVQTSLYGSTPDRLSKHVADKLASIEQKAGKSAKPSPPTSR